MRALVVLALAICASSVTALSVEQQFVEFARQHGKVYENSAETFHRLAIFRKNLKFINEHNAANKFSYTLAVNQFADLTVEEFARRHGGATPPSRENGAVTGKVVPPSKKSAFDWRSKGIISPILDQGTCASCWAFVTTSTLQASIAIKTKNMTAWSEQQLLDCAGPYGNGKCDTGGWMEWAYQYVNDHGLCPSWAYPYEGQDGVCRSNHCRSGIRNGTVHWDKVIPEDENSLQELVTQRPAGVAIDLNEYIQFYSYGIFNGPCARAWGHGVTVIGWDTTDAAPKPYWILRNQWGRGWGEQGYMRIQAGVDMCGISEHGIAPYIQP